ncbi:hypothetical protein, partial [Puerhibacterium puerhi]|uniref:hypothetical protein n=1 Tax=Puerhibacterium puerhi TaxID=2692623 RepID=UPI001916BF6D
MSVPVLGAGPAGPATAAGAAGPRAGARTGDLFAEVLAAVGTPGDAAERAPRAADRPRAGDRHERRAAADAPGPEASGAVVRPETGHAP